MPVSPRVLPKRRTINALKKSVIALLCIGAMLGLKPIPAAARSVDEITGEINSLNGKVQQLDAQIAKLQTQIDQKQGEIRTLASDIESLDTEIQKISLEIQDTETKIQKLEAEIEKTQIEIRTKEREITDTKKVLSEYLRLIADADNVNPFEILLSGKSFSEILNQFQYTESLQKKTQESLEQVKQLKVELDQEQAQLQQQHSDSVTLRTQLEGQRDGLNSKRAEKDHLLSLSRDQKKEYEGMLSQNKAQEQQAEKDISDLEKELASQTGGIPTDAVPPGSGVLAWPAICTVVQEYGMTDYAKAGAYGGAGHNGIDCAAPLGTPLHASADGVVSGVGDLGGVAYGRWVSIHHPQLGFDTLYGHMLSQSVHVGQSVKRGELIGLMGSTGYATGPHVHLMVCFNLQTVQRSYGLLPYCNHVNPRLYL